MFKEIHAIGKLEGIPTFRHIQFKTDISIVSSEQVPHGDSADAGN